MILKWTQERVLTVSPQGTKENPVTRDTIILLPGINEMTDAEWESVKGQVAHLVKNGSLSAVETKVHVPGKASKTVTNFKDLPLAAARKLVVETTNPELLQAWLADERVEISSAVRKRMEALELHPDFIQAAEDAANKIADESPVSKE